MASTFFGSNHSSWGVQVIEETTTFGLNNTLIKVKLNACTSSSLHYFKVIIMCFIIFKFLHTISYFCCIPVFIICLVNISLNDILTHPQSKRHSQQFLLPKGYVESGVNHYAASNFTFQYPCFTSNLEEMQKRKRKLKSKK